MFSWYEVNKLGIEGKFGPRWIKAAAIQLPNGKILYHSRHHLIIQDDVAHQKKLGNTNKIDRSNQGFLLNTGQFLDRKQALELAISNGQITEKKYNQYNLFSEELWTL